MSNSRKKILILIDWFAPGYKAGGPIQSCVNLCNALKDEYDMYVLTTNTDHGESTPYSNINPNKWIQQDQLGASVYYGDKVHLSINKIKAIIDAVAPDFIYLNLLFSPRFVIYPLWLVFLRKLSAKVILCPRGSLYASALSLKAYKKIPLLRLYYWLGIHQRILFHATNIREQKSIGQFFPGSKIIVANNLPNMRQAAFTTCRKEVGILQMVFVARLVPIKNLLFLLEVLAKVKAGVTLTIVGPIEDTPYWESCQLFMRTLPANINCSYIGPVANDDLQAVLLQQHLLVLPTTGENFGHAIFEALLAGRPVLISDQTPWLNLTAHAAGWHLPLNDKAAFAEVIETVANYTQENFDVQATNAWKYAATFISNSALIKPYKELFS